MRRSREESLAAFAPERFGLTPYKGGWTAEFPQTGTVAFASLDWTHNQAPSFWQGEGNWPVSNALELVVKLQEDVWGFPPEDTVPVNILSIIEDTGASLLVAYRLDTGFNAGGWLGFAFGIGTRHGAMYSHMLGVRTEFRGGIDLGWYLKVLQGYLALKEGFDEMTWTVDPMRGANARLNQEKLAALAVNLTLDKYGVMRSTLYGNVPTDRFTNLWDMRSSRVHERIQQVYDRSYRPLRPADLAGVPEATVDNAPNLRRDLPPQVAYRVPGDIDELMRTDPQRAIDWRNEMRAVLGTLMTRRAAIVGEDVAQEGPIAIRTSVIDGPYDVTGFATELDELGNRESLFLLERKDDQS
jgi:predicted GNAT superfamily acetyltransferase